MERKDKKLIINIVSFAVLWTILCLAFVYFSVVRIVETANNI